MEVRSAIEIEHQLLNFPANISTINISKMQHPNSFKAIAFLFLDSKRLKKKKYFSFCYKKYTQNKKALFLQNSQFGSNSKGLLCKNAHSYRYPKPSLIPEVINLNLQHWTIREWTQHLFFFFIVVRLGLFLVDPKFDLFQKNGFKNNS